MISRNISRTNRIDIKTLPSGSIRHLAIRRFSLAGLRLYCVHVMGKLDWQNDLLQGMDFGQSIGQKGLSEPLHFAVTKASCSSVGGRKPSEGSTEEYQSRRRS